MNPHKLTGRKQTQEHINKRVSTRKENGSYQNNKGNYGALIGRRVSPETEFKKGMIPHNKGKRINLDLEFIQKEHWENQKSIIDISKELGVSDSLIRLRMKENNIPIRPNSIVNDRLKKKISQRTKISMANMDNKKRTSWLNSLKGRDVWNKGLTLEDERVKRNVKNLFEARKYQIMPLKDSSIEIKIQNFLSQLHLEYFTHKYISIRHAYQCDIFIPKQETEGVIIPKNTILECDGCFWHGCSLCNQELNNKQKKQLAKDNRRTKELIGQGFRVIRLWEHEIKNLQLNEFQKRLK
jgi:G:T-mismatch repair DNA endonuclease (very short patch repair protein)